MPERTCPNDAPAPQPAKLNARAASWLGLFVGLCLGVALSFMAPANAARNGSGTYSLPNTGSVPNPVVTGTTITSTWANGTLSDISTEITNSLDRGGRGAMTAPLQLASGSVTAPGLTFSGDTNSGLYRIGADDIALATAGTKQLEVSSTAITATLPTVVSSSAVADSTAVTATGQGNGHGVWGYGGNGSGGGTKGVGVIGYAGTNGTAGVLAFGSSTGGYGLYSSAQAGGAGAFVVGGTSTDGGTGGAGASITAGGSAGGIGGAGLVVVGGTGSSTANAGEGIRASSGSTSDGTTRTTVLKASNGDIDFDDVAEVTYSTSIKNRLTPTNLVKAWGVINSGSGSPTIADGFNLSATITCGSNAVRVNLAQAFANSNYVVVPVGASSDTTFAVGIVDSDTFDIYNYTANTGSVINLCAVSRDIYFIAIGKQ